VRSLDPMLIVDDDRRHVDANAAARLFLRRRAAGRREPLLDSRRPP
jgi:hypothetical protein